MKKSPHVDLDKTQPTWLITSRYVEYTTMQIERLDFFGWVWGYYYSLRVTRDSKENKAGIDLILWAFGGDTNETEIERFSIGKFLL